MENKNNQAATAAWMTTLLISALPNIIWQKFFGTPTI